MEKKITYNERYWELWNTITHFAGIIISIMGIWYIISIKQEFTFSLQFIGVFIYVCSLVMLFTCSTFLHAAKYTILPRKHQKIFTLFDYSAIYILIAGTYTPFLISIYQHNIPTLALWLSVVWGLAGLGVVYQLLFNGKYKNFSTILYIILGWIIMFMIKPVVAYLPTTCIVLLVSGGLLYTSGTIFFSMKKPWMHTIWHVFVLAGSICMFAAVIIMISM